MLKGSDLIRLVLTHPLNSEPLLPLKTASQVARVNHIRGLASSQALMMRPAQQIGGLLFKTNGWAQSIIFESNSFNFPLE